MNEELKQKSLLGALQKRKSLLPKLEIEIGLGSPQEESEEKKLGLAPGDISGLDGEGEEGLQKEEGDLLLDRGEAGLVEENDSGDTGIKRLDPDLEEGQEEESDESVKEKMRKLIESGKFSKRNKSVSY